MCYLLIPLGDGLVRRENKVLWEGTQKGRTCDIASGHGWGVVERKSH